MNELWLCVRWADEVRFEVNGIFSTEEKAIARCKDRLDYIAPFNLDEEQSEERCSMTGQYYPHGETAKQGALRIKEFQKEIDNK